MPLDFPSSPTIGQQYLNWTWNGVAWVVVPGPPLASLAQSSQNAGRNYLDNALFQIGQRGSGPWSNGYTADRWLLAANLDTVSSALVALSDSDRAAIGDESAIQALQFSVTGNTGAGAYSQIQQRVENVHRLSGKTVTVSFWALGAAGIKLGLNGYQNFGTGGSPSAAVAFQATGNSVTFSGSWARYQTTFNIPSTAGKTLGTNGDNYTTFQFVFSSGTTNNAGFGNIGVQNGAFTFWGVQVEVGTQATPLEKLVPERDLARCQRFFQNWGAFAFAVTSGASGNPVFPSNVPVSPPMRASPTVSVGTVTYSGPANSLQVVGAPTYLGANMIVTAVSTNVYASCGPLTLSADL